MVRLHLNCQKDLLCHQLCLQRTSLEDELKYKMFTESEESTIIQMKVMRLAHLNAFRIPKIGLTGMVTWKIQMTAKAHSRHWIPYWPWQPHRGSGMPIAVGCMRRTKCSWSDSAYTEITETGWQGVSDGQWNWNKKDYGSVEKVE